MPPVSLISQARLSGQYWEIAKPDNWAELEAWSGLEDLPNRVCLPQGGAYGASLAAPQLEPTTLHTIVIRLGAAKEGAVPACGRAIHAQVLDWIRLADPETSEAIHRAQVSPLSYPC